ncbi:MAG: hypothetical protein ABH919_00400 [bacterium]
MGTIVESIRDLCRERKFEEAKIVLAKIGYGSLSLKEREEIGKIIRAAKNNILSPMQTMAVAELGQDISFRNKIAELRSFFKKGNFSEMLGKIEEIKKGELSPEQIDVIEKIEVEEAFFDNFL